MKAESRAQDASNRRAVVPRVRCSPDAGLSVWTCSEFTGEILAGLGGPAVQDDVGTRDSFRNLELRA